MSEERTAGARASAPELRPAAVPAGTALAVRSRPGPLVLLLAASDAIALVAAFLLTCVVVPSMRGRAGVHVEGVLSSRRPCPAGSPAPACTGCTRPTRPGSCWGAPASGRASAG